MDEILISHVIIYQCPTQSLALWACGSYLFPLCLSKRKGRNDIQRLGLRPLSRVTLKSVANENYTITLILSYNG